MSVSEKDVIITQAIGDELVKVKYHWNGEYHVPEIGSDCCGNELEYDYLVKSIVTTETFHHLTHEGKTFIHSKRHNAIADAASMDILIRVPAGNPARQIHFRFALHGTSGGTLDIDGTLYSGTTVSADGTPTNISRIILKNATILKPL